MLIEADGNVVVEGIITANGGNASANHNGGGSGGSVFITCDRFFASNTVLSAIGGNGVNVGRGGGGGRIAVSYNSAAQNSNFVDNVQFLTTPGSGSGVADIGSIYLPDEKPLEAADVRLTGQIYGFASWTVDNLSITNSWIRFRDEGFRLCVSNNLTLAGEATRLELGGTVISNFYTIHCFGTTSGPSLIVGGNMSLSDGARFDVYAGATNGVDIIWGADLDIRGNLTIGTGSSVYVYSHPTNGGSTFFNVESLFVDEGGVFSANEFGYIGAHAGAGYGPGAGSGAGYGGQGGHTPYGMPYGSMEKPEHPGSGGNGSVYGHGGHGGGFIRVRAQNIVRVDGTITANGGNYSGNHNSGGSGGGIFIECLNFTGASSGILSANGGNGYSSANSNNGGGGGGRIAIWTGDLYTETTPPHRVSSSGTPPASFEGAVSVEGGLGVGSTGRDGDPGTVLFVHVLFPAGTFFTSF